MAEATVWHENKIYTVTRAEQSVPTSNSVETRFLFLIFSLTRLRLGT